MFRNLKFLLSFLLISFFFLQAGCYSGKKPVKNRFQHKLLPHEFSDIYLSMPYKTFAKLKKESLLKKTEIMGFRTEYTEKFNDEGNIEEVTYYFDNDANKPLYELIIEYKSSFNLQNYVLSKYHKPNNGKEWKFDSKEGFKIRLWTFGSKLVIVATLKNTEWWESESAKNNGFGKEQLY